MSKAAYHPSIEGAQHGAKTLEQFLDYAKDAGATGAQPSNYMLQQGRRFRPAEEIKAAFAERCMTLDGISSHCHFWVHTTAWTGSPTIRPFLPPDIAKKSVTQIESWCEDYIKKLMNLSVALGVKVMPMFWGTAFGWEMASGYPWGFWAGGDYDLIAKGKERFVKKTEKLRAHANKLGIKLCHEIHPGTAAMCADDFNMLVEICGGDACLAVNADPSHCWEGETWESRFLKVGSRIYAAHVKNFVIRPGFPLRAMQPHWPRRAMQFTDLASGDLNMQRYVELLLHVGYQDRYCKLQGTETAPLVVEAESAHQDLDHCSADGIRYVKEKLCWPQSAGSFEAGMGA